MKVKPQTAGELFATEKYEWLNQARQVAKELCAKRGSITIQDVLLDYPLPTYLKKSILGQVFVVPIFRKVGIERSRVRQANGHYVGRWELREEFFPASFLTYKRRRMEEWSE